MKTNTADSKIGNHRSVSDIISCLPTKRILRSVVVRLLLYFGRKVARLTVPECSRPYARYAFIATTSTVAPAHKATSFIIASEPVGRAPQDAFLVAWPTDLRRALRETPPTFFHARRMARSTLATSPGRSTQSRSCPSPARWRVRSASSRPGAFLRTWPTPVVSITSRRINPRPQKDQQARRMDA